MFCPNCSKIIKEGTKFCQYCGAVQQNRCEETVEVSIAKQGKRSSGALTGLIIVSGVAIVALFLVLKNLHTCDWCDKTYVGYSYYDSWEPDEIMCEECAKNYYRGLDYTRFRVE